MPPKMKKPFVWAPMFCLVAVCSLVGCKKDETDVTPPSVEILTVVSPDSVVLAEQSFKIRYRASDNKALQRAEALVSPENPAVVNVFTPVSQTLSGDKAERELTIAVPASARDGRYSLVVTVFDAQGNAASAAPVVFNVRNPNDATPPELTVERPEENAVFASGGAMRVSALAADYNSKLRDLLVYLFTENGAQNLFSEEIHFVLGGVETYALDTTLTLPTNLAPGFYRLAVLVADARLNQTEVFRKIEVR